MSAAQTGTQGRRRVSPYVVLLIAAWTAVMTARLYPQFDSALRIGGRITTVDDYIADRCGARLGPEAATCLATAHAKARSCLAMATGMSRSTFSTGLMKTARSALWLVAGALECINDAMRGWDDEQFVKMLPLLRLALADLTPRETDKVARKVATVIGAESLSPAYVPDVTSEEMLRAVEVDRLVRAALAADGLGELCE